MIMTIYLPLSDFGDKEHENDIEVNDWIGLRSDGLLWNWIFQYKTSK